MIRAAVVGATGIVGQQFLVALKKHPWIEVKALAASERSAGQSYRKAITDAASGAVRWFCDEPPVEEYMDLPVVNATELSTSGIDVVFSAIESGPAKTLEPKYAAEIPVISTASAFRYEDDVPILIPGVNPGHARLLETQRKRRNWKGFVTPDPCTTLSGSTP
jgi:aspartate-semialdehyde dehydrogenase